MTKPYSGVYSLAAVLMGLDVALFTIACVTGSIAVFFAAVFILAFSLLEMVYLALAARGLRVARSHSPAAVEGEEFFVEMAVANFSYLPVFYLEVQDGFAPARSLSINRTIRQSILPRSVYEYTARTFIAGKVGIYQVGPVDLLVTDPFGLFTIRRRILHHTTLTVYPALRIPALLRLLENPLVRRVGEEIIAQAGTAADFRGPRDYRRGDPKRTIHWPATARHGRMIVKEFDETGVTDVAVFVDHRRIALRGTGTQTSLELALHAAASVAGAAARGYHRFAVDFIGHGGGMDGRFGTGIGHLHLVLQAMVSLGRPGMYADYGRGVRTQVAGLRRHATAVFIVCQTPTPMAEMEELVALCRVRGVWPFVILIDDRSFLKVYPEQTAFEREAPALAAARAALEAAGARVLTLDKRDVPADRMDAAEEVRLHFTPAPVSAGAG
jgi:uncharacterized protein (DUF58 family)